jgi:hypothetical protein
VKTLTREVLDELIDFAPTEAIKGLGFAEVQAEGTLALHNMLARNQCAYLADEVGMGKTYVALGVMALMRYFNPMARVVVLAPRENIQHKWVKELRNFVRNNWRQVGNRVKAIDGNPVWEPVCCNSLHHFANEILLQADRDFFLRTTSFSIVSNKEEARRRARLNLRRIVRWLPPSALSTRTPEAFRDAYGCAINAVVPDIDLLIVDEAHNLKHGYGPSVSTRNRVLAHVFGRPSESSSEFEWYRPKVNNVLLLSATPFEDDYSSLYRQFDIFGFGSVRLKDANGRNALLLRDLTARDKSDDEKREIVNRVLVRRVSGLQIEDRLYTKNMYRREWRKGGYTTHDEILAVTDPRQRLVVALMQKKVSEVLQDERFNNQFQIGMLSSFESFLETIGRRKPKEKLLTEDSDEGESVFDGAQDATDREKRGIDTDSITQVAKSHRKEFGTPLPHPKLDETTTALADAFRSGEKALVFVRRVATVKELTDKLDLVFDGWMRGYMEEKLPEQGAEIERLFARYQSERTVLPADLRAIQPVDENELTAEESLDSRDALLDEGDGSTETFYSWFFRGKGVDRYLSGAAFLKNRLGKASGIYALLFEDDYVSWLLGRPADVVAALADACGLDEEELRAQLRRRAYQYFKRRSRRKVSYPPLYVFESYQVAALNLLAEHSSELGENARVVADQRYPAITVDTKAGEPPDGFPEIKNGLGICTLFTELAGRPALRERLWPDEASGSFVERFRRREQRRELFCALSRLGRSFIDLYLLAIRRIGTLRSTKAGAETQSEVSVAALVNDFLELLEEQSQSAEFGAFDELASVADAFDQIIAVNFEQLPGAPLPELSTRFGKALQKQMPVGRMAGGVNKRLVAQFRMPGFPFVMVTTDVLQEGEDLHTFCRRIVHYGITWTPSAIEQRIGRIDRIGSLVQRRLDGRKSRPPEDEFIQVYYPHLADTVEVLQVRRVLRRVRRFLQLAHKTAPVEVAGGSRIDTGREMVEHMHEIAPITGPLESAFPVEDEWLRGDVRAGDVEHPTVKPELEYLTRLWAEVVDRGMVESLVSTEPHMRVGRVRMAHTNGHDADEHGVGHGVEEFQQFTVELRSKALGEATLLRCKSYVGELDLAGHAAMVDLLYDAQIEVGNPKICVSRKDRAEEDMISIEHDIVFDHRWIDLPEFESVIRRTVNAAAALQRELQEGQEW